MRRNSIVELVACHIDFGMSETDSTTRGSSTARNFYDPDREYMKQLLAYEMYGPKAQYGKGEEFVLPPRIDPDTGEPFPGPGPHTKPPPEPPTPTPGASASPTSSPSPGSYSSSSAAPPVKFGPDGTPYYDYGPTTPGASTTRAATSSLGPATSSIPARGGPRTIGPRGVPPTTTGPPPEGVVYPGGPPGPGIPPREPPTTIGPRGGPPTVGPRGGPTEGHWQPSVIGPPPDLSTITKWNEGGASGNRQLSGGLLFDSYGNLMNSQGYSDTEKGAIMQEGMNAARAQTAGAQGQIARRAAATGNTAGNAAGIAALSRTEGANLASQARQNTIDFAKEKQRRRELGLQGMGGLYTGESNYLTGLMGQRGQLAAAPIGKLMNTGGTGNYLGTNFGFGISL